LPAAVVLGDEHCHELKRIRLTNRLLSGIAGRSPSYIVRQLYDFKLGARAGIGSALMKPTVERLTMEDMVSLAAYVASLTP